MNYLLTVPTHESITYIPLEKIKPLAFPESTDIFEKIMVKEFKNLLTFDLILPVEKNPKKR